MEFRLFPLTVRRGGGGGDDDNDDDYLWYYYNLLISLIGSVFVSPDVTPCG